MSYTLRLILVLHDEIFFIVFAISQVAWIYSDNITGTKSNTKLHSGLYGQPIESTTNYEAYFIITLQHSDNTKQSIRLGGTLTQTHWSNRVDMPSSIVCQS